MTEQLEFPLPALVAACRLAQARRDTQTTEWVGRVLKERAEAAVQDSTEARTAALWRLIHEGSSGAVLPFSVDPVTAAAAAISAAKEPVESFRLFSDESIIDLGYAEVTFREFRYVDRNEGEPTKRQPRDFPPLGVATNWLHRLRDVDAEAPIASFAEDSGDRLRLTLDPESSAGWGGSYKRLNLALLRSTDGSPPQRRSLGSLAVKHLDGGCVEVQLTGEQQLEVHAAHFAGAIVCVDDGERWALFPVPSLDAGAPATKCRSTLPDLGFAYFPFMRVCVPVPVDLALQLGRLHWWFNPVKSFADFAMSGALLSPPAEPLVKHA